MSDKPKFPPRLPGKEPAGKEPAGKEPAGAREPRNGRGDPSRSGQFLPADEWDDSQPTMITSELRAASGPSAPPPEPSAPDAAEAPGFKEALSLLIGVGALTMFVMLVVAVHHWAPPWLPLVASVGIAAASSALIAYLYCERDRERVLLQGGTICAFITLPTALWMFAPLRATAIEMLGDHLPATSHQAALDDPAEDVRLSACAAAATTHRALLDGVLAERFSTSPTLGARCIARLTSNDPAAARALSYRLIHLWDDAVRDGNSQFVCSAAARLFSIDAPEAPRPAHQLTYCATNAADSTSAKCCADTLVEHIDSPQKYVQALGEPQEVGERQRLAMFTSMVAHGFRGVDAARTTLPVLEQRLLRQKPTQDWIVGLGCQALFDGERLESVIGALEAIVETRTCGSVDQRNRRLDNWMRICVGLSEQGERSERICTLVEQEAVTESIDRASAEVRRALDSLFASQTGKEIIRADNMLRAFDNTPLSRAEQLAEAMNPDNRSAGFGGVQERMAGRQISANYAEAIRRLQEIRANAPDHDTDGVDTAQKLLQKINQQRDGNRVTLDEVRRSVSSSERDELDRQIKRSVDKYNRANGN